MTVDTGVSLVKFLKEKNKKNPNFFNDLINIVDTFIKNSDWPHSYGKLKNNILPDIFDFTKYDSSFLTYMCTNEEYYSHVLHLSNDEVKTFIKKFYSLFSFELSRVETWLDEPMAFFKVSALNTIENHPIIISPKEILRITRADGKFLDLKVNEYSYQVLVTYMNKRLDNLKKKGDSNDT